MKGFYALVPIRRGCGESNEAANDPTYNMKLHNLLAK